MFEFEFPTGTAVSAAQFPHAGEIPTFAWFTLGSQSLGVENGQRPQPKSTYLRHESPLRFFQFANRKKHPRVLFALRLTDSERRVCAARLYRGVEVASVAALVRRCGQRA